MNSDVSEFKSFLRTPHRQQELEEARGELLRVNILEGQCVAIFAWGAVSLPGDGEMEPRLRALIGHEIGILRLDGKFHIRDLDEEAENAA